MTTTTGQHGVLGRWEQRGESCEPKPSTPDETTSQSKHIPPLVKRILASRGLTDQTEIESFMDASLHDLCDVSLMPGIEPAAERMVQAVRNNERIAIYGDYDVDGITASAILYHILKTASPEAIVRAYIPHRVDEGYGINTQAIETLAHNLWGNNGPPPPPPVESNESSGADLIVSVDCGITAIEPARRAAELGVDLIITDHHNPPRPGDPLPVALALVHPGLPGSEYPCQDLCGAGVAFKLAWRFATLWCGSERVTERFRNTLTRLLALAALGTIADIVPLVDENRVIAKNGLRMMRHTGLTGLDALIDAAGLSDTTKLDSTDVGFRIAPRINACGRMGHAREAVDLLTTIDDPTEAQRVANELNRLNEKRRAMERSIFKQACDMAEGAGMTDENRRVIVLAHEDWHPGVVGIVCSRLVEKYHRPTILMQRGDDLIKGSARSIPDYSIHAGLEAVSEHLHTFGGHDMAAGVSVKPDQYEQFVGALTDHANENIEPDHMVSIVEYDTQAEVHELDEPTVRAILDLGPFGRSNPRPALLLTGLRLYQEPRRMGQSGKHLSLTAMSGITIGSGSQGMIQLVGWSLGHLAPQLAAGKSFDAIVQPDLNTWRGRTSVQCVLCDLRL